jgi:hypothetical protein
VQVGRYRNMPTISGSAALFAAARAHLASYVVRVQQGLSPVTVSGTVVDGRGRPVAGADISDGVLHASSNARGGFRLAGVAPAWRLTVTHPLYTTATIAGSDDEPGVTVTLAPAARVHLVRGFDRGPLFRVAGRGDASRDTAEMTGGASAARLVQRRDLHRYRSLSLDVLTPDALDHASPWFLCLSLSDAQGHAVLREFLLRPGVWNRLSLTLRGHGLALRHVASLSLRVSRGAHTLVVDTLVAR